MNKFVTDRKTMEFIFCVINMDGEILKKVDE